jgi:hypothetical protein
MTCSSEASVGLNRHVPPCGETKPLGSTYVLSLLFKGNFLAIPPSLQIKVN